MKIKHMAASDLIEQCDAGHLTELVHKLTEGILDYDKIRKRVNEAKRVAEMRKDPEHEAWTEQR